MSAGGSFNPSGGPIDNQQRLQTSPNPSLPPADYSMGYARNFQTPSFFNPFSGYYGANTGMGGFQSQFGGFQQPQFGGFGGFGGGFQQPQYGGFQQQQFGGFGGGFQQPFDGGFGRQSNRFTRRGQEYTQPQPQQITPGYGDRNRFNFDQSQFQPQPVQMSPYYGMGNFGGFDPMMGGGIGAFGGFQQQRDPNAPPPGMMVNPDYDSSQAMLTNMPLPGSRESLVRQPFIRDQSQPERLPANMMGGFGGFNPMMGGLGGFRSQFPQYQYADSQNGPPQTQLNQLYSDMRRLGSSDTLQNFEPSELNTLTYLARANGIPINPPPDYPGYSEPLSAMASQEETTRASQKIADRGVDYLKQQFAAKNIDFGDSALAPYRQKVIEDTKRFSRMHNA